MNKNQTDIINYMESIGAYVVKIIVASRAGVPDIICCLDGQFIAIESKQRKEAVSKLQDYNINKINQAGGIAIVARSVKDVREEIKNLHFYIIKERAKHDMSPLRMG